MEVKETLTEGLKREYQVTVLAGELDQRVMARLNELKDRVNIPGFRPGKVPLPHLKRVYGRSIMGEVIQQAVNETNQKIVDDAGFKLALEPQVTLAAEGEQEVKSLVEGKADLSYKVAMEILPKIEFPDFKKIKLVRPVAEVTAKDLDDALKRIADANKPFVDKDGKAADSDRLTIDFKGSIDGVAFEGGTAEDVPLVIGAGQFIPGFEEQLTGAGAGDKREVKVAFPADYQAEHLAGKAAVFDVTVKKVESAQDAKIDDEFAKSVGAESLDKMKEQIRDRIRRDYNSVSRAKVKRALLDALDKEFTFAPPPSLVEQEFDTVWKSIQNDLERRKATFADDDTTEEEARAEYRAIADRRVRLGLAIAELGERNNIKVSEDEVSRALMEQARQFPGQEQQVWDHFRNNPQALAGIRAPLFEDKVVDFLLELADVSDKTVTREELAAEDDKTAPASKKGKKAANKKDAPAD